MASNRSRKFKSIGNYLNNLNNEVQSVNKNLPSPGSGIGESAVGANNIATGSVGGDLIATASITADKFAEGVAGNSGSGVQRVPALLTDVAFWEQASNDRVPQLTTGFFTEKSNRNVSATDKGLELAPEKSVEPFISHAELLSEGLVSLTTLSAHGYEALDYITVSGLGSPFDGEWVITSVPDSTSICYNINQFTESTTTKNAAQGVVVLDDYPHRVISKSFTNGTALLVLDDDLNTTGGNVEHELQAGYVVKVSGLGSPYDGNHLITAVPSINSIEFRPDRNRVPRYETKVEIASAIGTGEAIVFTAKPTETSSVVNVEYQQRIKTTGFTDSDYNLEGYVEFIGGSAFQVPSTYTGDLESGGTYYIYTATIKVEADATVFVTAKNPIPESREITISWSSDTHVNMYIAYWTRDRENSYDPTSVIDIDSDVNLDIFPVTATDTYLWKVPTDVAYYTVYADVPANGETVILKSAYVFENIGDYGTHLERITSLSISNNIATLSTGDSHPFLGNELVKVSGLSTTYDGFDNSYNIYSVPSSTSIQLDITPLGLANTTANIGNAVVITSSNVVTVASTGVLSVGTYVTSSNTSAIANHSVVSITNNTAYVASVNGSANTTAPILTAHGVTLAVTGILSGGYQQSISTVSPAGLILNDPVGGSDADTNLKAEEDQTLTIKANVSSESADGSIETNYTTVATITPDGVGKFGAVDANYFVVDGDDIVGTFADATYNGFSYSELSTADTATGQYETTNSYLNRLGRGVVYESYWTPTPFLNATTSVEYPNAEWTVNSTSTPYVSIASGKFKLNNERTYIINVNPGNMWINNPTNRYVFCDLKIGVGPLTLGGKGEILSRGMVGIGQAGIISIPSPTLDSMNNYEEIHTVSQVVGKKIEVVPAATGFTATLATGTNRVDMTGAARSFVIGQKITKTSGTGAFSNAADIYVTEIYDGNSIAVGDVNGLPLNHTTAGSIVFSSVATPIVTLDFETEIPQIHATATYSTPDPQRRMQQAFGVTGLGYPYDGYWTPAVYMNAGDGSYVDESFNSIDHKPLSYALFGSANVVSNVGIVSSMSTTANISTLTSSITVANTYPLAAGFRITKSAGTGNINTFTRIVSVDSATEITIYPAPITNGTFTFDYIGFEPVSNTSPAYGKSKMDVGAGVIYGNVDVYWSLDLVTTSATNQQTGQVTNADYTLYTSTSDGYNPFGGMLHVIDTGNLKSATFNMNDEVLDDSQLLRDKIGSQSPAYDDGTYVPGQNTSTTVTATVTLNADQSAYYDNYGRGTGTSDQYAYRYSLYQGNPGTASGTKKSAVRFPTLTSVGVPSGSTVTKVELYLRNRHSYYSSGLTAYIGAHIDGDLENQTTAPTGRDFSGSTDTVSAHFDKGQGKWVTLPSSWYSDIASGTVRGVLIGLKTATNTWDSTLANYGYFDGNTMSDEPKLRVTYNYTS